MGRLAGALTLTEARRLAGSREARRRFQQQLTRGPQLLQQHGLAGLPATAWTPAEVGTSPTVGGLTFDVVAVGVGGTVSVGGGQGLRLSGTTTATIRWRVPKDFRPSGSVGPAAGGFDKWSTMFMQFAVFDSGQTVTLFTGAQNGAMAPQDYGWNVELTGAATLVAYRQDNIFNGGGAGARVAAAATGAYMLVGTQQYTHLYKYAGVVDPVNIPHPNDLGWEYVVGGGISFYGWSWPLTVANDGRMGIIWNGTNVFRVEGYALWGV